MFSGVYGKIDHVLNRSDHRALKKRSGSGPHRIGDIRSFLDGFVHRDNVVQLDLRGNKMGLVNQMASGKWIWEKWEAVKISAVRRMRTITGMME
jgi:hypothetical protein